MNLSTHYPPADRGVAVVWGLFASYPFGGMIWQVLHHLVGLRRLGLDVWYVEDTETPLLKPSSWWATNDYSETLEFLSHTMDIVSLGDRWVFRPPGYRSQCFGAKDLDELAQLYEDADVVFNVCGGTKLRPEHDAIRCRVLLQTDPVIPQIAVAEGDTDTINEFDAYDFLFTYGENFGSPDCGVPLERYQWHPTRPPVCIDWWKNSESNNFDKNLTTIANWRNRGMDLVWNDETYYWQKAREFEKFKNLPCRSPFPLELSLVGITDEEETEMRELGWKIASARALWEPHAYRDYIRQSLGEFTVAKDQNIRLRSGWFSDRSACYLASGLPVITQDTGFNNILPTGDGLFAYSSEDEAAQAIEALEQDYIHQSRAASEIAHNYFDAEKVLGNVLETIGI